MLSSLLLLVLTQLSPCTPGETSLVCGCKQGMASACETLFAQDAGRAAQLLEEVVGTLTVLEQASRMAGMDDANKWLLKTLSPSVSSFWKRVGRPLVTMSMWTRPSPSTGGSRLAVQSVGASLGC